MSAHYVQLPNIPGVAVRIYALFLGGCSLGDYLVYYRGRPDDLVAAGVATTAMVTPGRKGTRRADLGGVWFQKKRLPSGKLDIGLYRSREAALAMPGVTPEGMEHAEARRDAERRYLAARALHSERPYSPGSSVPAEHVERRRPLLRVIDGGRCDRAVH